MQKVLGITDRQKKERLKAFDELCDNDEAKSINISSSSSISGSGINSRIVL